MVLILSKLDNLCRKKLISRSISQSTSRSIFALAKFDREIDRDVGFFQHKLSKFDKISAIRWEIVQATIISKLEIIIMNMNGDIVNSPMQIPIPIAMRAP